MDKPAHNKVEPIIENKNAMTYPTRTLDPPISIIDQAKEIENATEQIQMNVNGKLDIILAQIKHLQNEARKIINDAYDNIELHKAQCNFQKIPGQVIHLYEKIDKTLYFSRLSPDDWRGKPPHSFKGSYKLQLDRSFEKIITQE